MKELPPAVQARIERALAELELVAIRLQQHPPQPKMDGDGGWFYDEPSPTAIMWSAAFAALAVIVDTVTAAELSATERRQIVATAQDQLLTQYELGRVTFIEALRTQPFWEQFHRTLREAERTDIRSFGQQLAAYMLEAHLEDEDLAAATSSNPRTVERHRTGTRVPKRRSITAYMKALSAALNRPILFTHPPPTPRTRRSHARRKRGPKRS